MEIGAKANPYHVMVDLETLGNGNDAAIWSIGAVKFSLDNPAFEKKNFYVVLDLSSVEAFGLKFDASTIRWWMSKANDIPRQQLVDEQNPLDLVTALEAFRGWLPEPGHELSGVWGNGATFDNIILRNAYKAINMPNPWSFRLDRCFRTINQMFPMPGAERKGVAHNALDDAINQAEHLISVMEKTSFNP